MVIYTLRIVSKKNSSQILMTHSMNWLRNLQSFYNRCISRIYGFPRSYSIVLWTKRRDPSAVDVTQAMMSAGRAGRDWWLGAAIGQHYGDEITRVEMIETTWSSKLRHLNKVPLTRELRSQDIDIERCDSGPRLNLRVLSLYVVCIMCACSVIFTTCRTRCTRCTRREK